MVGGSTWTNLVALSAITGPAGATGPQGPAGPAGATGASGGSTNWRGAWSSATAYSAATFDAITFDGSSYVAIANSTNQAPPNATFWQLLAAKGDAGATGATGATGSQGPAGTAATYSDAAPQALGATASAGTANSAAREDHIHQRDVDTIVLACSDETTALATGTNRLRFRMPFPATLLAVRASVNTAPTGSTLIVDINEGGTSVLGTKLSIDATEFSSTTAASAATITDSSLADDAEISIDIDQIGSTVAGAGLKVTLSVRRS